MAGDIVYIDDEPDPLLGAAGASKDRLATYVPPHFDGAEAVAADANLWVFDFFNNDGQRQDPNLGGVANNGLSVFQQFRLLVGDARPPAVLVSNHLDEALGADPQLKRPHVFAERLGVDWIAQKNEPDALMVKLVALADASVKIRGCSGQLADAAAANYTAVLASEVLALPQDADWKRRAIADVSAWRPPAWQAQVADLRPPTLKQRLAVHQELHSTRAVVAWLLRQVLPHPSFVVTDRQAAVRLGLDLACLRKALAGATKLAEHMGAARYAGVLCAFVGPRWWSAGIDALNFDLPVGGEERSGALAALVAPIPLRELEATDPVVVSDEDLVETDEIASARDCVRAADDAFPAHAPPAWVKIEAAREDKVLAKKVRLDDQAILAAAE